MTWTSRRSTERVTRVAVHITPRSARNEVIGWRGAELAVRVTAPPEGGKANAAVCVVVARAVGVPKSAVSVVSGQASRHKVLEVTGVTDTEVVDTFGPPDESLF